jgi:hypothetical protein
MPYNLKTFKKNVPAELLKLAGKHKIRECDEEEKGKGDGDFYRKSVQR